MHLIKPHVVIIKDLLNIPVYLLFFFFSQIIFFIIEILFIYKNDNGNIEIILANKGLFMFFMGNKSIKHCRQQIFIQF